MRILFLAHRLPYPPNKGDKIRSFWELRTLAEPHIIDLFCFYDDPQDQHEISKLRQYCDSCYAEPISGIGSRLRAASALIGGQPFSKGFFYSKSMAQRISRAIDSSSYDLIFVFGSAMAQYAEPFPHLPRIVDLVDVDSDKWLQYSRQRRGVLSWLWRAEAHRLQRYEAALVHSFSRTLLCTDAELNLLRAKAPSDKISVLQNWLDLDYFDPSSVAVSEEIRALQPYVIFTGAMDYFPNIDAVCFFYREVLPALHLRIPNLRFVIAGRSPAADVRCLAADPAVHVTGTVPDVRPYLRGARAAVAPMRIARGVQNKILEALAMDLPVFASSGAAAALPGEIASLVIAEDNPYGLAERMSTLLIKGPEITNRRQAVDHYFSGLDLSSQLHSYVCAAWETRQERKIEVSVQELQLGSR